MPRIPLYNQGLGPQVKTAAGSLSPRANSAAFASVGQAQAAFFEKAGQVAFAFGQAEKQAETSKAQRDVQTLVNQEMNNFTNENQDTTVSSYQASAQTKANQLRASSLENLRGSLTRSQFQKVSGTFDSTFASKLAQGTQVAFGKNQAIRTESANQWLDTSLSEFVGLNPEGDLFKRNMENVEEEYDTFISQGLKPKYSLQSFKETVDSGSFVRGLEGASQQHQIDKMRKQTEARDDLRPADFSARMNAIDSQEKVVQAELIESVFTELVETYDESATFQTDEGLSTTILEIREGKDIVLDDGQKVNLGSLNASSRETLISKLTARRNGVEAKATNVMLVGLSETLAQDDTSLSDIVSLEEQLANKTGRFAKVTDITQIAQVTTLLNSARANASRKAVIQATANQADLIASIEANKGVMDEEDENLLASTVSTLVLAEREDLANALTTAVTVEQTASVAFSSIQFASPSEQKAVIDEAYNNRGTDLGKKTYERLLGKVNTAQKEMTEDFVGYYTREREGMRPSATQLITIQENMGIAPLDIRVASNAELKKFKDNYDAAQDYNDKSEEAQKFLSQYGVHGNTVMRHLVKTGTINKVDNLIIAYPNSVAMKAVDIFNRAEMVNGYKSQPKDVRDAVETRATELIGDYSSSLLGGISNDVLGGGMTSGRASHVFGMRDIVRNTALGYITSGSETDVNAAVDRAYEDVIGSHFEFHEVNDQKIRFASGEFRNPAEMTELLGDSLSMNEEYLRSIVKAPPSRQGSSEQEATADENEYFSDLMQYGSWRTTTDNKSVYLVDALGNMVTRTVEDGQDPYITVPFSKLSATTSEYLEVYGRTRGQILDRKRAAFSQVILAGQLF
jgi:hypothetical protein